MFSGCGNTIVAVNESLNDRPELINEDCYGEGWMVKFAPSDKEELKTLLTATEYEAQTEA